MKRIFLVFVILFSLTTCKKKEEDKQSPAPASPGQPAPTTYTVKYYGNGNTGGLVPSDSNSYNSNNKAVVIWNIGNLYKTGYTFMGWNSDSSGTGADFCSGDSVTVLNANVKLYARWIGSSFNPATQNSSLNCGGTGWSSPSCASSGSLTLKSKYGATEVILSFNMAPTTGTYNVSPVSNPSNVQVTILNAPNQPCVSTWYGKVGSVSVNTTSNSINASLTNIFCTQANFNFPIVTLNGNISCN